MKQYSIEMGGKRGGKEFARQLRLQTALQSGDKSRALETLDLSVEQARSRLHRRGGGPEVHTVYLDESSHLSDAFVYGLGAQKSAFGGARALSEYKDAELVMEMLKRGFAVMPVPDNGPPGTLK